MLLAGFYSLSIIVLVDSFSDGNRFCWHHARQRFISTKFSASNEDNCKDEDNLPLGSALDVFDSSEENCKLDLLVTENPLQNMHAQHETTGSIISLPKDAPMSREHISEYVSKTIILGLGAISVAIAIGELLVQFEWLQSWRYFWPLVGCLFMADPIQSIASDAGERKSLLPFLLSNNPVIQVVSFVGGAFLVIGGAYDAFMPVWQTGPNVFTIAGIGQDGAAMLLAASTISVLKDCWTPEASSSSKNTKMLLQILLLGELYKLSESSIDEIVSVVGSLSTSS